MGKGRELGVGASRVIAAPPDVVFGVVSDTNRWNRLTGVSPTSYTYELLDADDPTSRTRIGHARAFGVPVHFAEEGEYWSGVMLRGERRFLGDGLGRAFSLGALDVQVAPEGDGARVRLRCAVVPRGVLGYLVVPLVLLQTWLVVRGYLRWLDRTLARVEPGAADEPATAAARRALIAAPDPARAAARKADAVAREAFRARSAALATAPVDRDVVHQVLELLMQQPEEGLLQIRPFEVARAWGADRREVLRAFLYATRAGLFDLEWQVNCPTCRVGTEVAPALDALGQRVHCADCDISFDVDFADNVEATFTANEAIRRVPRVVFCASSPYFRPHVHGYVTLAAGAARALAPLPAGALLVRARGTARQLAIAAEQRGERGVAVRVTDTGIERVADHGGAPDELRVTNASARPVRLLVERAGWSADIARGSLMFELPELIELFGSDAPAAGMRLAVGAKAVAFTDVVASTELYQRLGDARAFALIQEHWRDARAVVESHAGAIVKTMGDGMMCVFPSLADAIVACFELIDSADALAARHGVAFSVRAGAHEGPCFAARANDRLDLFGTTVNLAARLVGVADGRQLALLSDAIAGPALQSRLNAEGALQELVHVRLRGVPGVHAVSLASRAGVVAFATGEHARVPRLTAE